MTATVTTTETATGLKPVSMWKVTLHNDDHTPMDFVVAVLRQIFNKGDEEATKLMMQVHDRGKAVIGLYTREVAETKVMQTMAAAERHEHPLLAEAEAA